MQYKATGVADDMHVAQGFPGHTPIKNAMSLDIERAALIREIIP